PVWVYSNSRVTMNVFMLRTFWIRSANICINLCKTHFSSTLQLDHRHSSRDMHLQLREVGRRRFAAAHAEALLAIGDVFLRGSSGRRACTHDALSHVPPIVAMQ